MADTATVTSRWWNAPLARLEQIPPRTAGLAGGVTIAVFAVLGTAYAEAKDGGIVPSWFRVLPVGLNGEGTLPAIFSGLLLLAAGLLSFRASEVLGRPDERYAPLVVLGTVLTFMAFDEVFAIHEWLEEIIQQAWWKFYAPIAVVAGVCAVLVLRRVWSSVQARTGFLAGGVCWLVAQLVEAQQYDGDVLVHRWTILPEEILEMTGSLLFVLALLVVVQSASRAPEATHP